MITTKKHSDIFAMWRPFFDLEHLRRFAQEIPDHPQGAGRGGVCCPKDLVNKSRIEYSYLVKDGKTTGNCCVQAFIESALEQGVRPGWKKMGDAKRCQEGRKLARDWALQNQDKKFWGGCSFQEAAWAISHVPFQKWTSRLRLTDVWADIAFLQALACALQVDILLIDDSPGAKLLGVSLMDGSDGDNCKSLVPMCMHAHYHFWPLVPLASCVVEQVHLTLTPGNPQSDDCDPDFDTLQPAELVVGGREQEIQLCEALLHWSPFDLPTPKLIECLQNPGCLNRFEFDMFGLCMHVEPCQHLY